MTFYTDMEALALGVVSDKSLYGVTSWTVVRPSGDGIPSDVTLASQGAVTAYIIGARFPTMAVALAGLPVWDNAYLILGASSLIIQADDILTDGTRAYRVAAQPNVDFGPLFAPADACEVPAGYAPVGA